MRGRNTELPGKLLLGHVLLGQKHPHAPSQGALGNGLLRRHTRTLSPTDYLRQQLSSGHPNLVLDTYRASVKPPDAAKILIEKISPLLSKRGTQAALAKAIGVTPGNVSEWLKREHNPGLDRIGPIAAFFRMSVSELFSPEANMAGTAVGTDLALLDPTQSNESLTTRALEERDTAFRDALADIAALATTLASDPFDRSGFRTLAATEAGTRRRSGQHRKKTRAVR